MKKSPNLLISALCLLLAPAVSAGEPERFRFAAVGCAHIGKCGAAGYAAAIERIKEYKPAFLLTLGGMTEAPDGPGAEAACRDFAEISGRLGTPVRAVTGGCALSTAALSGAACPFSLPPSGRGAEVIGGALFILLDSETESGLYSGEQLAFLEAAIAGARPGQKIFVAAHRSPWAYYDWRGRGGPASESAPAREWMEKVHPLLKGRVSAVLGAGEHYALWGELDGVQYLMTGVPACVSKPGSTTHHFLVVEVDGASVTAKAVPVAPDAGPGAAGAEIRASGPMFDPFDASLDGYFLTRPGMPSEKARAGLKSAVSKFLDIRPGMEVLDLGAGNGFFTFAFADALKGKGKVYATEIDRDRLAELAQKARERAYRGVEAVLVSPDGLDPFYTARVFDRIFVGGVYDQLPDPYPYFAALRSSLKPGSGRILLVIPNSGVTRAGFTREELGDMKPLVKTLQGWFGLFPGLGLSEESLDFIRGWDGGDVPYYVRLDLARRLTLLAKQRYFFSDLAAHLAGPGGREEEGVWKALSPVAPEDRKLAFWLITSLKEQGAFRRGTEANFDRLQLQFLNNLLLRSVFGLQQDLDSAYNDFIRNYRYPGKEGAVELMERAGYRYTREFTGDPPLYYLEFKAAGTP